MDGGRGYISELELVRNNGRGGFEVGGGNINREDVVCNNGRSEGSSEVGKNKGGDGDCCDFRINGSKGEYEGLKGLDGNREEERKFVEDMVMYREENGNSGSKGNEGMIEVERSVQECRGKDGEDVVRISNVKGKKVEGSKDVYGKYNLNIDQIIKEMKEEFCKSE